MKKCIKILEVKAICLKSIIQDSHCKYIEEMYSRLDNVEDPFKDHNKMIRTKSMVICEMGAEYILQYIDKIMKQNKIKIVHFDKKNLKFSCNPSSL